MAVAKAPVPVMFQSGTKQIGSSFYESTGEAPIKGAFVKAVGVKATTLSIPK